MKRFFYSLKFVLLLFAGIFVAWGFAMVYEWHFYFWWVDMVLHFAGGFWVFVLARFIAKSFGNEIAGEQKKFVTFIAFISFVAFVGVLWELFEFVMDRYIVLSGFTYLSRVFEDTLSDLVLDMLGGTTAFLLYFKNDKT